MVGVVEGALEGLGVGDLVGSGVLGERVGLPGRGVGPADGARDGTAVGLRVGDTVGMLVGKAVGWFVGCLLGDKVGESVIQAQDS